MANYTDDLDTALHTRLATVASLPALRAWDVPQFTRSPLVPFAADRYLVLDPTFAGLGDTAPRRTRARYQVSIYTPVGAGRDVGKRIAADVATAFQNGGTITVSGAANGNVLVGDCSIGPDVVDGSHWHWPVVISLQFHHT
jgi:hypothetical protein